MMNIGGHMPEGTRLVFWLDVFFVIVLFVMSVLGKWDWALVVFIALLIINIASRIGSRNDS